jgi:hypothetical protein
MAFYVKILDSDSQIQKKAFNYLLSRLKTSQPLIIEPIKKLLGPLLEFYLYDTDVVKSLLDAGSAEPVLNAEFGIVKGEEDDRVSQIINQFISEIEVESMSSGRNTAKFKFGAIRSNYIDVLSLDAGKTYNLNYKSGKTKDVLPWLEWLLIGGGEIEGFDIKYINTTQSRSGKALMKIGSYWSTPQEFAPIGDNNFVTQAINNMINDPKFMTQVQGILINAIQRLS